MGEDWYSILESIRKLLPDKESTFDVDLLNSEIDFSKTATRTSEQTASVWISKLVRWGYAKRVGSKPNPGYKSKGIYQLTDYGRDLKRKVPKLDDLRDRVRQFEGMRGTAGEEKAYRAMIALCDEFDREEAMLEQKRKKRKDKQ